MKWILLLVAVAASLCLPALGEAQLTSITLDWTAPGDDGNVGTAATYQMRWRNVKPDTLSTTAMDAWWAAATIVSALPVPTVAGTAQTKIVAGTFAAGQSYYFVLKACDEKPNCSGYSNVAVKAVPVSDTVAPAKVTTFRPR